MIAGVSGRSSSVIIVAVARGRESCMGGRRQGVVPGRLFGDMVRVMA